ncbi:MAG: 7-carboxy-7-deazaguanine synthase QueE [Gammaproteobacteria bacterium]|nr:7-carboxy-7-deazaguanine synthase QueE [Gammaproteobacteria bacterium]
MGAKLRITEIFYSLQGETSTVGVPTVFIRLTGCPLRCQYCDTAYAFSGGVIYELENILQEIKSYNTKYITVTGGEPLAQEDCHVLLTSLCDLGYKVSLETSGAMDISRVDSRVVKILDIKTPGSAEMHRNLESNIEFLQAQDQVKFVICTKEDYLWAQEKLTHYALLEKVDEVLFSPSKQELEPKQLAEWILKDQLQVRMQVQLHKYLWGDQPGH